MSYSASDKFLHKFYLSNYTISSTSLEIDEMLYGSKTQETHIEQHVFVTGLARSGTTAVMRKIHEMGEHASLQYNNMPFLLCPNLWNRKSNLATHERAHKDGIKIDGNSPEEFDEYFWKVFLKDSYITKNNLTIHNPKGDIIEKYLTYTRLVCHSKGKRKYISKNNNNILRLSALQKIDGHKIIFLYRHPISHAASLLKLHKSFTKSQEDDSFVLDYFNFLGHHEFGMGHLPFQLGEFMDFEKYDRNSLEYWLAQWINYYSYFLKTYRDDDLLVMEFDELIKNQREAYQKIFSFLQLDLENVNFTNHRPTDYKKIEVGDTLKLKALEIYEKLREIN